MAYTTIDKSSLHFNTKLYTGNGSNSYAITGVGFEPSFVWIKDRTNGYDHCAFDQVRGVSQRIYPNNNGAQSTDSDNLVSFDSDGFTLDDNGITNANSNYFVSWNWTGNGAGSSNSDGSITSTVSANATSKVSIVTYTGTGANATVGHGLGVAPTMILFKQLSATQKWIVYHKALTATKSVHLDTDEAEQSNTFVNNTAPTSSVFSLGTVVNNNTSSATYVAYCFSDITGFSHSGSYTGNGAANGPVVYTGFKPSWVLIKSVSSTDWNLYDNKRLGYNGGDAPLFANLSNSEATDYNRIDFLSNGFKIRTSNAQVNNDNTTMLFTAFGQTIASSNNIAATAR